MESKVNINPYKPPQFKKQPNASFEKAKTQDLNRITELYTIFKTMDYEEIMAVIETNEILNFKTDKGETLIFALLNNPSSTLNESKIKNIIELLVVKNVSINAMNEFNQNVLHLACKKGYFLVIDYLLSLKCNRELVDNYGNAPIHYVIEEFIRDCKGGEMYNYKNLKLKYLHENVDVNYLTKLMMVSIIEEVESIKGTEAGAEGGSKAVEGALGGFQVGGAMTTQPLTTALDHLKKFIGLNRLFKGEEVVTQMEDNITKLGDRYLELLASTEQKVIKSELQKKMLEQKKEYEQLYAQFKVVVDDIDGVDNFNEYARQIEVKIAKEKADCNKKIKEHLDVKLTGKCDEITEYVMPKGGVYELYDDAIYLSYLLYYIHQNLNAFTVTYNVTAIKDKIKAILIDMRKTTSLRYVDYSQFKFIDNYKMTYKQSNEYPAHQYSQYMLREVRVEPQNTGATRLHIIYEGNNNDGNIRYFGNQIFNDSFLGYLVRQGQGQGQRYNAHSFTYQNISQIGEQPPMFNLDNVKMLCDYVVGTMEMIKTGYTGDMYVGGGVDGNCEEIITIYTLYETILNVINNLILIKYDIEQHVNMDTLKLGINELKRLMEEQIMLKDDNQKFTVNRGNVIDVGDYGKHDDNDRTNYATAFFEGIIVDIDTAVKEIIKGAGSVDRTLNEMYKQLKECIDIINQVINEKNKFFSLTYLEQYIACFKGGKGAGGQGDVSCIFYNRLREINTNEFPLTFTEYYLKHQAIAKVEGNGGREGGEVDLLPFMPDLPKYLVYMHNYDFNIFFKEGIVQKFRVPYLEPSDQGVWTMNLDDRQVNVNTRDKGEYSTGYFLCLYKEGNSNRVTKKIRDIANIYPPITERMEERGDGEYQFIHVKNPLQVCDGIGDAIMPIALEHTGYIMKIIIAKIVFVVGGEEQEQEGEEFGSGIVRSRVMRGGAYDSIIAKVIAKIAEPRTQQQIELVKILESLKTNKALLKKFINKYILSLIEKNISVYIGDECGELMALQVEKLNLSYPDYAQIVRLMDITPLEFRKGVDMTTLLFKDGGIAQGVKDIVVSIYNKSAITHAPNSKKVFRNKCANVNMSNFECVKRLGIRLKDRNGNTILNRLIDQYNIPALKTLIRMDPGIKTFRNNRNQTPQEYIKSLLKIIADKYDANTIKSRIIKYGYILMSYLEPTALVNVDLDLYTSEEFIVTIIKYNICMFNEFLWFHMLEFNNLLTVDELMAVLRSMDFMSIHETELLEFKTLLASNIDTVVEAVEQRVEESIDDGGDEERNKTEQVSKLKGTEITTKQSLQQSTSRKESLQLKIKESIKESIKEDNFTKIADYKTMIDNGLYGMYYDIIRNCFTTDEYSASMCPKTVPPIRTQPQTQLEIWEIASLLLKLELKDSSNVNINNFFKHFVKKIYEDYYDLDQNEDAEYNYVQHEILSIIFVNVGSMVALELVNRLIIYCDKHHNNSLDSVVNTTIETRDKLYAYAKDAIIDEIIEKLGVKNPDKQYTTTDTHDDIIIDALKTAYSFVVGETDLRDIKQIITFYRTLAENIAKNSYDEMRMILDDLRRKSLLIEIATILQ
jgi:flagellar motor protein MotB